MKIPPSFWTAVFSDKSTYWDFRLSTYREINLLLVSSINLILSGNPKNTHRSKYTTSLLFNSLERNNSRTFKSSNCRNIFLQRVCYCAIWFDKCFLFHIITGRLCFFYGDLSLPRSSFQLTCSWFLWKKRFEKSLHFILFPPHHYYANTKFPKWSPLYIISKRLLKTQNLSGSMFF